MAKDEVPPPSDKLDVLKAKLGEVRDIDREISDLVSRAESLGERRTMILTKTLPDLLDDAGVPKIEIEASGNLPAMEAKVVPYYSASIAASWPEERRAAAFKWLDESGNGDLIKTTITVQFPREDRKTALDVVAELRKKDLFVEVKDAVSQQTLTKWLKETYEDGGAKPPLDVIGGSVGRVVKVKELK